MALHRAHTIAKYCVISGELYYSRCAANPKPNLPTFSQLYSAPYCTLSCGLASHSTQNRSFRRHSSQPISWLSTEKRTQTQQTKACARNKIYCNIKLTQKTKSCLFASYIRHPAWKRPILFLALHKFVTYLLA